MAEDLVRILITKATSILFQHVQYQFNQLVNVEAESNKLIKTLKLIQSTLHDAENKEIVDQHIKTWLKDLKLTSYDIDDTLNDWNMAVVQVNGNTSRSSLTNKTCLAFVFPCFYSKQMTSLMKVAIQIRNINRTLVLIDARKNVFRFDSISSSQNESQVGLVEPLNVNATTSYTDPSMIYGRDDEKEFILSKLTSENGSPIVFIYGMGGIGKTTLAQVIFNSVEVQNRFEVKLWVSGLRTPINQIRGVNQKRFILVLDDVWAEDFNIWKPLLIGLNEGASGSKIVITSQNEEVGRRINAIKDTFMHPLRVLSDEDSWTVFKRFAFAGKSEEFCEKLNEIGRKVSDKCGGLPLALEAVGSLMDLKDSKEEWEHVLNDKIWRLELGDRVSNPLMLSYYNLPSVMKRCFCYCANFPKGTKIDAANLIQMWISQGYLGYDQTVEMEITGRGYLNSLVRRSLFLEPERDKDSGTILRFKMHDMVHDVASYLMEDECLTVTKMPKEVEQTRHLTVALEDDTAFPIPHRQLEKLYSFSIQSFHDCPEMVGTDCVTLPHEFFNNFKYLKTLDLSRNMLLVIPNDINKLKSLCYLNLSHNPLYELPETVCDLPNLQTLKLFACYHLTRLPQSIGKLEKLRHLEFDETRSFLALPKGVAKLTALRTLSKFVIGNGDDVACSFRDLKNLNHLRGCLVIEGLEQTDASEAKDAELEKKEHVSDLHINCGFAWSVIDGLKLNSNLEVIRIDKYGGQRFSNWMVDLTNLKKIRLNEWTNCTSLPPFGKLPFLKVLHVEGFKAITHVGSEFVGVSSTTLTSTTAFPKLEKLKFSHMEVWKEWNMGLMNNISVMPCIRYLNLSHCDKLQSLPQEVLALPIKKLRIRRCTFLKQRYRNESGENMEMVSHISNLRIQ
ncbi:putative disease resistance protein RGA3 [Bidens hawaiensis]|uniref:putative disease resistance protein RGA3 n=1 Tax=Bidens hawaiensis TaxID=980011 RepID=UPI00404AAA83